MLHCIILAGMRHILLSILIAYSINADCQIAFTSIKVVDNLSGVPLANVKVKVQSSLDSTSTQTGFTDTSGIFVSNLPVLINCIVYAEKTGYKTLNMAIKAGTTELTIGLLPVVGDYVSVKITGKQKFIVQDIDKTVVYPDGLVTAAGQSALDMIERAPGVIVEELGGIRIQGMMGVSVYVNEQLLNMSGDDLNQYLKSIPADNIQSITVMTNPSSKYPAAGSGGVIVIRMKKSITKGFNGRYGNSLGTGKLVRHNQSLNLNYRINKVNFFGNGTFGWNNNYQDLTIRRAYYQHSGALNSTFVQNTFIDINNLQYQANVGADMYVTDNKTLSFSFSGFDLQAGRRTTNHAEIKDGNGQLLNLVDANIPLDTRFRNLGGNINYDIQLDSGRAGWTLYSDVTRYHSRNTQSTFNSLKDANGVPITETLLIGDLPSYIWVSANGVDYHKESSMMGRFESGIRISYVDADNYAGFFDEINGIRNVNNLYTNDFDYTENINAGYINWSKKLSHLSIQSGLRYEQTNSIGNQKGNGSGNDSSFSRHYHSWFPTVFISYTFDSLSKHLLGINYGRRINRPNYSDMNPFIYPLDRYTLYAGNPFIQPTFSNEIELSYFYNSKWRLNAVYGITNNLISETIEQVNGIFYSRPGNIGKQLNYGLNLSGNTNIGKFIRMNLYAELNHNIFSGELYGQSLRNAGSYWYVAPNLQFKLHTKWNAEVSGTYQSAVASSQFVFVPVGSIRTGVSWQFNKDGVLRLSLNDIMHSMRPGGNILSLNNSEASWNSILDTRIVTLGFSYKFNRGQSLNRYKNEEIGTEKQRVRVG